MQPPLKLSSLAHAFRLAREVAIVGVIGAGTALTPAHAATTPPQLDPRGISGWQQYQKGKPHRAFAIAPGGHWGWRSGLTDAGQATDEALAVCNRNSELECLLFDLNGRKVLSAERWTEALAPYPARPAATLATGTRRGQRFPAVQLRTADGQNLALKSASPGVTVLHFWGSWCGPCLQEIPEIAALQKALRHEPDIHFILVPLREPLAKAQTWLRSKNLTLPLATARTVPDQEMSLLLENDTAILDRQITPVFPTTYFLDRQGVVLFAQHGQIRDWDSFASMLKHAAQHAGR